MRPRVSGRGISVVGVRGVCVGRAPDVWCTSNGPSVTTWGSSSSGTMACRRHSVNRAPARPGAWCGPLMPGGDGVYFKQGYDRRFDSEPVRRDAPVPRPARHFAALLLRERGRVRVGLGDRGTASGHRRATCRRGQPARLPGPPVSARSVHSHRGGTQGSARPSPGGQTTRRSGPYFSAQLSSQQQPS